MKVEIKKIFTFDDGSMFELSEQLETLLRDMQNPHCSPKIALIKFVRTEHPLGLKEAKDLVDYFGSREQDKSLGQLLRDKLDHA